MNKNHNEYEPSKQQWQTGKQSFPKRKHEHRIREVKPGSIGEEMEIEAGDYLLEVNGEEIEDIFDYQFLIEEEEVLLLIRKADGEEWELEIEKDYTEDIGLVFENSLMDEYHSCRNKCMFCFIDQMPKGMRETLYFKDDDSRLSFLQGNYITLTNMSDKDIDRIIRFHLAPINISVHTTNPELRCKMLTNRFAGDALKKIDRLYEAEIPMNGQIVLCKGVNDGEELKRSIRDLLSYAPVMRSVSVVPVGLTKYRDGLYPLEPFDTEDAKEVLDIIEWYQREAYEKYGIHFIHASDEWYILAGEELPQEENYDGYLQLENGVGMMRLLLNEFEEAVKELQEKISADALDFSSREISMATARLAYPFIRDMAARMMEMVPGLMIHVYEITNNFFGEMITVSGLLTGQDLIAQLTGKELGEALYLPQNVLRSGEEVFLDDVTVTEMEKALQVKVDIIKSSGRDFVNAVLDRA